jgi:predicted metal-dependent TIM-barrel fold hydrolase
MFDAHLVARGLPEEDLETLHVFGVTQALLPTRALFGNATAAALRKAFDDLLEVQVPRLAHHGITGYAAIGIPAASLPARGLRELLNALPEVLAHPKAVAVGALSLLHGGPAEEDALLAQLSIAARFNRPALVTPTAKGGADRVRKLLVVLRKAQLPPSKIVIDGCDASTVGAVKALGFHAGLSLHPDFLTAERAAKLVARLGAEQLLLSSRAGESAADLLALPRAVHLLTKAGISRAVVDRVSRGNAAALFGER